MRAITWIQTVTLGAAVAAAGCQTEATTRPSDGAYRYVIGFDEANGQPIIGGVHRVVQPRPLDMKTEAIDSANQTTKFHPQLTGERMKFDDSITEGKSSWPVFASNWWPQSNNGTAWRWQPGADQDYNDLSNPDMVSPMEKYDLLVHPGQLKQVAAVEHCEYRDFVDNGAADCTEIKRPALTVAGPATKWEMENQGNYQTYGPENWWGHCNGWASYATAEPLGAPKRDVRVKLLPGNKVEECTDASDDSCVFFRMADIEALMTELYFSDQATFSGSRCNTSPDEIERDEYGRPTDSRCRDLNAGSFHVAMTNLLGKGARNLVTGDETGRPAFVIDHNWDFEIWNFPVTEFEIFSTEEVTAERANELIGANDSDYQFNPAATKFVVVRAEYKMVSDGVPPHQLLKQAEDRTIPLHPVDLNYVLELNGGGVILGGEWIQDPSTSWGENSKELHPDFMWMATDPIGWGENADDTGGNSDNPFVKYPVVKAILACANDGSTCAPDGGGDDDGVCAGNCGDGPFSEGGAQCYCDDLCTQYGDCCSDYTDECTGGGGDDDDALSCAGSCGSSTPVTGNGESCYCDTLCTQYGDCCDDKEAVCN
jgi:hypothetical protein